MAIEFDTLPGLAVFARIVRYGSLSGAANSLGMSRSAVSKQLSALESQIGVRLLQRTTRKQALTEAGEQVYAEAQRIETSLGAIDAIRDNYAIEVRGKLKISCSTSLGRVHLVPLLYEFSRRYPAVEVNLQLEDRFVDLVAEQVDVAIRIGHLPDSSLVAKRLGELEWQLCASPAYIAEHGSPKSPADLAHHECLFYRNINHSMNNWTFLGAQGEEHVSVRGSLTINDGCALVDAAVGGQGILLIDKAILGDHLRQGRLVPLLQDYPPAPGYPVYAVYPARFFLNAKTTAFMQFLIQRMVPRIC